MKKVKTAAQVIHLSSQFLTALMYLSAPVLSYRMGTSCGALACPQLFSPATAGYKLMS